MADMHVMNALTAKHGELFGHMEDRRRELKQLGEELAHVEATMRLFDPQWVVERVPARHRAKRRQVFRGGECQRLVLDTLRDAQGAISEDELVAMLVRAKGLAAQPDAMPGVRKTLLAVLRHLARQGVARSVALQDGARAWRRS
jgi:hypothetical protein